MKYYKAYFSETENYFFILSPEFILVSFIIKNKQFLIKIFKYFSKIPKFCFFKHFICHHKII